MPYTPILATLGYVYSEDRQRVLMIHRNARGDPEGALEWVAVNKVADLPLWEGDRHFLPLVFDTDPRPFHGVMPYSNGRMVSWTYSR